MLLSSDVTSILGNLFALAVIVFVVVVFIIAKNKKSSYMKKQKETGTDKKKVMDAMEKAMGNRFHDYTYAVGYYTKQESKPGKVIYYYYPYILAFSTSELVIFPFLMRDGELLLRNCMNIDWKETKLDYSIYKKGTKLHICVAGEWMPIYVHKVIDSDGTEKSDRPLGIYQEQEVDRLISLLPQYKNQALPN